MGWNERSDPDMRTANFCDVYREGVYWLIFPGCFPSLPSSFAPFKISLCLQFRVGSLPNVWCRLCPALSSLVQPCPALPCPALPCLVQPCLALSSPALPCPALPCLALCSPALPCLVQPCPAMPCPALPCLALSSPALPCPALPCLVQPCPALSSPALPCLVQPCPALPCPALPCPALSSPALPCPALPCLVQPCLALSSPALPCLVQPCPALPCPALPCLALSSPALPCPALTCLLAYQPTSQSVFPLRGGFCLFVLFLLIKALYTSSIWVLALIHSPNPDTWLNHFFERDILLMIGVLQTNLTQTFRDFFYFNFFIFKQKSERVYKKTNVGDLEVTQLWHI